MMCNYCLGGKATDPRLFRLLEISGGKKRWSETTYRLCDSCKIYLNGVYKDATSNGN